MAFPALRGEQRADRAFEEDGVFLGNDGGVRARAAMSAACEVSGVKVDKTAMIAALRSKYVGQRSRGWLPIGPPNAKATRLRRN